MTSQKEADLLERYGLAVSDLERVEVLSKKHFGSSLQSIDSSLYEGPFQVLFLMNAEEFAVSEDQAVWLVKNWGPQSKDELKSLAAEFSDNDSAKSLDFSSHEFEDLTLKATNTTHLYTTDFEQVCEILSEFSLRLKSDKEVIDMFDNDFRKVVLKGLEFAHQYVVEQKKLKSKEKKEIDFAWRVLLESCDIGDIGFEKLDDILFR